MTEKRESTNYYTTPERLPIANFIEIQRTQNLRYLVNCDFFEVGQYDIDEVQLKDIWKRIIYQLPFLDLKIEKLDAKMIAAMLDFYATGKPAKLTDYNIAKAQLEKKLEQTKEAGSYNLNNEIVILEKVFGFQINKFECSTSKFFHYRKYYEEYNKTMDNV